MIPDRITEVNAFDLDNNGNVSDIRVDFIVTDNLNVTEYRVMVIPNSSSNSFDQNVAVNMGVSKMIKLLISFQLG